MDLVPERCRKTCSVFPTHVGIPISGCERPGAHVSDGKGSAVAAAPPFFCGVVLFFVVLRRPGLPLAPLTPTVHRSRATGFVLPVRGSAAFWWRWATPHRTARPWLTRATEERALLVLLSGA